MQNSREEGADLSNVFRAGVAALIYCGFARQVEGFGVEVTHFCSGRWQVTEAYAYVDLDPGWFNGSGKAREWIG